MPFTDSLKENTLNGRLYVSILGGNTANTEFEALTGNSLSLLSPAVIPYQNQVQHDMPSLARILEAQGYETMAMHPSGKKVWNREQVYAFFGFDTFIHQGVWEVPYEYVRNFISDACNYDEIIHRYENRNPDAPFFLFDVTIQNHSGYYGEIPMDIDVVSVGGIPAEEAGYLYDLQTYINLLAVGTALDVFTSMGISCRFSSSFLSKKGILIPAFPINTLGFLRRPEIMIAVSGEAFTYPVKKIRSSNSTTTATTIASTGTCPIILLIVAIGQFIILFSLHIIYSEFPLGMIGFHL